MATVHLTNELLAHAGGAEAIEIDADRVDVLLNALVGRFPGLADFVHGMAIAIDGEIHQEPGFQPLAPRSEVHFVPRIAGG